MASSALAVQLTRFRASRSVIGRFVWRRTARSATFWALVFGAYVASKASGYVSLYPTEGARLAIANSFGNNLGLTALLGKPLGLDTVAGFVTWNTLMVMMIFGSIWAMLLATKTFRGEEDAGRWELLLAGQTTARRAAANTIVGLASSLVILFVVAALGFAWAGTLHGVDFGSRAAVFFAAAVTSGPAMFVAVGMLASQLMPTRHRATELAAGIFGVSFLLRALADTTNTGWLLTISPLGWIEKMQPLYHSQAVWLWPVVIFIVVVVSAALILAGKRDLGGSTFADNDTARPHTRLLNSALGLSVRLTRSSIAIWLVATVAIAIFFGLATQSAASALSESQKASTAIARLTGGTQAAANTYLGIVFMFAMIILMSFAASSAGAAREQEAAGYLDNLLVRAVARLRWIVGRILLHVTSIIAIGLAAGVAVWLSTLSQDVGLPLHTFMTAGLNTIAPAIFVLGAGILTLGWRPRLTTFVGFGILGWSFLIQMLGSGLNLNHWLLDTSIFTHVALAPAVNPHWTANGVLCIVGVMLGTLGVLKFVKRDLETE
ncbi:MAG TPA: hypothetical protein VLH84_05035 [Patescibacteria group bacterium]|nr:hypothetical protein [Patescibacteria group bacterium]